MGRGRRQSHFCRKRIRTKFEFNVEFADKTATRRFANFSLPLKKTIVINVDNSQWNAVRFSCKIQMNPDGMKKIKRKPAEIAAFEAEEKLWRI